MNCRKPLALEVLEDRTAMSTMTLPAYQPPQVDNVLIGMLNKGAAATLLPAVQPQQNALIGLLNKGNDTALLPAVRSGDNNILIGLLHTANYGYLLPAV